jgi:predicted metal-dependent peptidase
MKNANRIVTRARIQLLLKNPFFGQLAMRLKLTLSTAYPIAATDGTHLYLNPDWVTQAPEPELQAVIAHEVLHCALLHPYRRQSRNPQTWNVAADYVINAQLTSCGFTLPAGCLLDSQYNGQSSEQVYSQLQSQGGASQQQQDQAQDYGQVLDGQQPSDTSDASGQGEGDSNEDGNEDGPGQPTDPGNSKPGNPTPPTMSERDWQQATAQAAMTARKTAGSLPGDLDRQLDASRTPQVDWRSVLQEFVSQSISDDYTWQRPNRRTAVTLPMAYTCPAHYAQSLAVLGSALICRDRCLHLR